MVFLSNNNFNTDSRRLKYAPKNNPFELDATTKEQTTTTLANIKPFNVKKTKCVSFVAQTIARDNSAINMFFAPFAIAYLQCSFSVNINYSKVLGKIW